MLTLGKDSHSFNKNTNFAGNDKTLFNNCNFNLTNYLLICYYNFSSLKLL